MWCGYIEIISRILTRTMDERSTGFDLSRNKDVNRLLDFLENGVVSDLDEESDDEIIHPHSSITNRDGSGIVCPNEPEPQPLCEENLEDDQEVEEEVQASGSNKDSTNQNTNKEKKTKPDIIWRKHLQFETPKFSWAVPPISEIVSPSSPIEYFKKYIPDSLLEEIVFNTNLYANTKEVRNFKQCSLIEMKIFIALHIIMGNLKFPRIQLYWDRTLDMKVFLENMPRDRFLQLRNNLHIIDNNSILNGNSDRLIKVRPLYNSIRNRCLELKMEQILSVDEQIVPFRGNLNIKQYVKGKPEPWGIKIFMLCGKSGMVYDFIIYQGATTNIDKDDVSRYGASAAYVNQLSRRIICSGHFLFFDNYFSNYNLLGDLRKREIYAGGTIRVNRFQNPPLISDKDGAKKPRGYSEQVTNSTKDILVLKWMDNKGVILASNFVGIGEEDEALRWNKATKQYISIPRPELVRLYNNGMGGVDKIDHLLSLYRIFIRSKKWTLRMISHAIDLAVTNSWLEYKEDCQVCKIQNKDILDLLHFRQRVAEALIKMGKPVFSRKRGRPSSSGNSSPINTQPSTSKSHRCIEFRPASEIQYDTVDHLPEYDKKKEATRCKKPDCKGKTHVYCLKCDIHLCFVTERNCFRAFHQNS